MWTVGTMSIRNHRPSLFPEFACVIVCFITLLNGTAPIAASEISKARTAIRFLGVVLRDRPHALTDDGKLALRTNQQIEIIASRPPDWVRFRTTETDSTEGWILSDQISYTVEIINDADVPMDAWIYDATAKRYLAFDSNLFGPNPMRMQAKDKRHWPLPGAGNYILMRRTLDGDATEVARFKMPPDEPVKPIIIEPSIKA